MYKIRLNILLQLVFPGHSHQFLSIVILWKDLINVVVELAEGRFSLICLARTRVRKRIHKSNGRLRLLKLIHLQHDWFVFLNLCSEVPIDLVFACEVVVFQKLLAHDGRLLWLKFLPIEIVEQATHNSFGNSVHLFLHDLYFIVCLDEARL